VFTDNFFTRFYKPSLIRLQPIAATHTTHYLIVILLCTKILPSSSLEPVANSTDVLQP